MSTPASFPHLRPHNYPYNVTFSEAYWTVGLEDASTTNTGPIKGPLGSWLPPTDRRVNFKLATLAKRDGGRLIEEYIWADGAKQSRQLGFLLILSLIRLLLDWL